MNNKESSIQMSSQPKGEKNDWKFFHRSHQFGTR